MHASIGSATGDGANRLLCDFLNGMFEPRLDGIGLDLYLPARVIRAVIGQSQLKRSQGYASKN